MRCGALGIANFAINMIPGAMLAIMPLALFFYVGRACISATKAYVRGSGASKCCVQNRNAEVRSFRL